MITRYRNSTGYRISIPPPPLSVSAPPTESVGDPILFQYGVQVSVLGRQVLLLGRQSECFEETGECFEETK